MGYVLAQGPGGCCEQPPAHLQPHLGRHESQRFGDPLWGLLPACLGPEFLGPPAGRRQGLPRA
eukprot:3504873-Lingulodinium_polyedra.AAC.1